MRVVNVNGNIKHKAGHSPALIFSRASRFSHETILSAKSSKELEMIKMVKRLLVLSSSCLALALAACSAATAPTTGPGSTDAPPTPSLSTPLPSPNVNDQPAVAITATPGSSATAPSKPAPNVTPSAANQQTPAASAEAGMHAATLVIQDISAHASVAANAIVITRLEAHDWPDAGLGCPKAGTTYAQVITPGWLIEAKVSGTNGSTFEYHTNFNGDLIMLCKES